MKFWSLDIRGMEVFPLGLSRSTICFPATMDQGPLFQLNHNPMGRLPVPYIDTCGLGKTPGLCSFVSAYLGDQDRSALNISVYTQVVNASLHWK